MPREIRLSELMKEAFDLISSGGSVELIGPPGCGKTEFAEQVTKMMAERTGEEWGFATINATTALPITVPGFPLFSPKNERGVRVTEHTEPVWMTCRNGKSVHEYKRGMLLIDERRSAEGDIKKQLADVILNKRSGNHALPEGWVVWSTGNRTSDRSGATKDFDFIINRHIELHIRQDIEDICDIYAERGMLPMLIAFAQANPQVIIHDNVPDVQGPWCTARSYELVSRLIRQYADAQGKIHLNPVRSAIIAGQIGDGATHQLETFLKMANAAVQFSDIIADPHNCPVPERADLQMLVSYTCASRVDSTNIDKLTAYMSRLPEEFAAMFVKASLKREPKLINSRALGDWCAKNATLLAMIVSLRG